MSRWFPRGGEAALTASHPCRKRLRKKLILQLIAVLNSAFDLGLSTELSLERTGDAIKSARLEKEFQKLIAVVGGSHAGRLAE